MTRDAFLRLETLDDLHDAVVLALSGYNLTFEPVAGALGGKAFLSSSKAYLGGRGVRPYFPVSFKDTPHEIAEAVRFIASVRDSSPLIARPLNPQRVFYLEPIGFRDEARREKVLAFLRNIHQAFDMRAGRPCLSETDIIGVMEWLADFAEVMIVAQVPYGAGLSSRWWGRMVRGETSSPDLRSHSAPSRMPVSLFCHAKPKADHLTGLAAWAKEHGREIVIVNGAHADRLLPGTRGTSADGRILLSNHCLIERVPFDDRPEGDEALYSALKGAGAEAFAKTTQEPPEGLQRVWGDQMCTVRPCAVEDRSGNDWAIFESHVSAGIFKAGQERNLTTPYRAAGCFPVEIVEPNELVAQWDELLVVVLK